MARNTYCHGCGVGLDLDKVQNKPFKNCPVCGAPLDADAVAHAFVEASNPSDLKDGRRAAAREQHLADVAQHVKPAGARF